MVIADINMHSSHAHARSVTYFSDDSALFLALAIGVHFATH